MTEAYVTLPPKSMLLVGHFRFWAADGPKWPHEKCQADFLAISVNNLRKKSHWQELRKKSHDGFFVTQGSVLLGLQPAADRSRGWNCPGPYILF